MYRNGTIIETTGNTLAWIEEEVSKGGVEERFEKLEELP